MKKRPRQNVDVHNGFGEWGGYMDAKKTKLEEQFAVDALKNPYKESNLFAGISIFVNGLTNPSAEELKRIMMTHGGVYHTYQKSSTTFIIANNLPDVKIRQITSAKIINPQWVVDCLEADKILDYSNYLLYTNCKISQPKIAFKKKYEEFDHELKPESKEAPETSSKTTETNEKNSQIKCELPQSNILFNLDILNIAIRQDEEEKRNKGDIKPVISEPQNKSEVENVVKNDTKKGYARTAVDSNFLSEFYNNSRLHHIATLGASFKHHISKLRESHDGKFPIRDQLKQVMQVNQSKAVEVEKAIMHIDMDCFFVSVGLRIRPQLRGFPIAVTHSKGKNTNNLKNIDGVDRKKEMSLYMKRHEDKYKIDENDIDDDSGNRKKTMPLIDNTISLSEIASCSYEARKMGVKNGMFVGAALKLCPNLKTIPYDFDSYKEVANILYDIITQYTVDVEAVSCDEMYVNLSPVLRILGCSVEDFVSHVRNEIIEKTECPCSAGIGENRLQARMATKKAKPNGQFHLNSKLVEQYFSDIPISDLPGVGFSTSQKCSKLCLIKCADLQQVPLVRLQQEFGRKMGETLYQNCRGIDNKPLAYDQVRKSVSAEVNYGIRFTEEHELDQFLHQLCTEVQSRLAEISAKGKTIVLKYMVRAAEAPVETAKFMGHGFCDNVTKSVTLSTFTCDLAVITQTVFNIKNILNVPPHELRGIGIQITKLDTSQINMPKVNKLKNMFEKAQAKQKLTAPDIASVSTKPRNLNNIDQINSNQHEINVELKIGMNVHEKIANTKLHKMYEGLDENVLSELPSEIQDEILRDNDRLLKVQNDNDMYNENRPKKSLARKLEDDFNDFNDDAQSFQVFEKKPSSVCISEENIFKSSEWRYILSNWLDNCDIPSECDIQIISTYFKEFAHAQKLCELMLFLKYFYRKAEKLDCQWHRIYLDIFDGVQEEIKNSFGPNVTLNLNDTFNCKNCINKNFMK